MHEPGDRPEAHCNAAEGSRSRGLFRSPSLSRVDPQPLSAHVGCAGRAVLKYVMAFLAVSGLFLSFNSIAAESAEEIVVTATRTAQTADQTLASVSVITREDIERNSATLDPVVATE